MENNINILMEQRSMNPVCIIGTGDFARAMAKRLAKNNFSVLCGSRFPQCRNFAKRDPDIKHLDIHIVSIKEAIESAEVLILALHPEHIEGSFLKSSVHMLPGKIIVDVTNPNCNFTSSKSHAEHLQTSLPSSMVVKAFNTISAYSLEQNVFSRQETVPVVGNSTSANEKVAKIANTIGFHAFVKGGLKHARALEDGQRKLFGNWGAALFICIPFFIIWFLYSVLRFHVVKGQPWSELPMHILNKIFGCCGLTYLSFCYLPGCVASITQLVYGTKHRAFPQWLGTWLKCRNEVGLIALYCTGIHAVLSLAHLSPPYFKKWYDVQYTLIPSNQTEDISVPIDTTMNWRGELCISLGVLGLSMICILGVTALPSVAGVMNRRQWHFVQRYLGYLSLILATAHVTMKGAYKWGSTPFGETVQGLSFLSLMIPYFTMAFRLILVLPPMSLYLHKVRRGRERKNPLMENMACEDVSDGLPQPTAITVTPM